MCPTRPVKELTHSGIFPENFLPLPNVFQAFEDDDDDDEWEDEDVGTLEEVVVVERYEEEEEEVVRTVPSVGMRRQTVFVSVEVERPDDPVLWRNGTVVGEPVVVGEVSSTTTDNSDNEGGDDNPLWPLWGSRFNDPLETQTRVFHEWLDSLRRTGGAEEELTAETQQLGIPEDSSPPSDPLAEVPVGSSLLGVVQGRDIGSLVEDGNLTNFGLADGEIGLQEGNPFPMESNFLRDMMMAGEGVPSNVQQVPMLGQHEFDLMLSPAINPESSQQAFMEEVSQIIDQFRSRGIIWSTGFVSNPQEELSSSGHVPLHLDDKDFFGGLAAVWRSNMRRYFGLFSDVWTLEGLPQFELSREPPYPENWTRYRISSTLRFCCRSCRIPWIWDGVLCFAFKRIGISRCHIYMTIQRQPCSSCPNAGLQIPALYSFEIERIVSELYEFVSGAFYGPVNFNR